MTFRADGDLRWRVHGGMRCVSFLIGALASAGVARAAGDPGVDEIMVFGDDRDRSSAAATELEARDLIVLRPPDLATALATLPSAAPSTNSRGETVLAVRGRTERGSVVYLNGAPFGDPWDGRVDFARLPAEGLGRIVLNAFPDRVASSAGGSVVFLETARRDGARLAAEIGDLGFARASAVGGAAQDGWSADGAVERLTRDAQPLSDGARPLFSQRDGRSRTNTDRDRVSAVVSLSYDRADRVLALTGLWAEGSYGVAADGSLDPAIEDPRYWRSPEDRSAFLSARATAGNADAVLWLNARDQNIDQYDDGTYRTVEERQSGSDREFGGRAVRLFEVRAFEALLGVEGRDAIRRERTSAPAGASGSEDVFRRRSGALFADAALKVGEARVSAGLRGDAAATLASGGREEAPDFSVWSARFGINAPAPGGWTLGAAVGRGARIPTQRELYGEALGRFLVNPDLKAETSLYGEASAVYARDQLFVRITPFIEATRNVIDQEAVVVDGVSRRRRINLDGADALGIEADWRARATDRLEFAGAISLLRLRRRSDPEERLPERPAATGFAALDYRLGLGVRVRLETEHRGRAYSLDASGDLTPLPISTAFNAEISWAAPSGVDLFLRADNALDAEVAPQLGLPAPGRLVRFGAAATF
ncbi:MAG: TonB-dependent receptor [Pseudomonadota bacterium]